MWVYNYKYPETGLDEFTVMNKEYVVNEKGDNRRLYAIETDYNIDFGVYDKDSRWYFLYQPFEDNRLYQWEHSVSYILSFDYEAIYDSWKEDLEYKKKRLEKQLEDCVEALDKIA